MGTYQSFAEMRSHGGSVVRLFRTALGRDPDPENLASCVARLRNGAALVEIARDLAESEEFQRRHGPGSDADARFIDRLCAELACGATGDADRLTALWGQSRAEITAAVADSPRAHRVISVLPGVTPGAAADDAVAYRLWVLEYDTPPEGGVDLPPLPGPRFTIVMPVGDNSAEAALRSAASLQRQVQADWQLRLLCRPLRAAWPRESLAELARREARVTLLEVEPGTTQEAALSQALLGAAAGFAGMLAPGDQLAPTAFYEAAAALEQHPDALLLYTDEDVLEGRDRVSPRLKPDVSPELMLAGNAIGQLALYRTDLLQQLGGLSEGAPHPAYDLALRASEASRDRIIHLPAVLCHRASPVADWPVPSDIPRPSHRDLAVATGGIAGWPGVTAVAPTLPRVSVIMPTRDHPALLAVATRGVLEDTEYPDLELLVVDNGSTDREALALLDRLQLDPRVRVLRRPEPFNFAALNNAAAAAAAGEVLLLLNNDVEILHPDWLTEMAAQAVRPGIGAVGARLLYPDGTLQHGGILLGPDGSAVHVGRGARADDPGYLGQLACTRELSAVTGACLATPRRIWQRVGGMDERLAVTWNDVDYCLRVRSDGQRVIWTPQATLRHHESVTRGLDTVDPERQARFTAEQALMRRLWADNFARDPFLNPNLVATEAGPLALTRPRRPRPWQRQAPSLPAASHSEGPEFR